MRIWSQCETSLRTIWGRTSSWTGSKSSSLAQALKEEGPFEWQRAATIISKVAAALQVAHDAGIIHRDIKPANILLDEADEPHVTDFGLVRLEASHSVASETMTGALLGTVDFVAPEQLEDPRNASVQSDIWSLGATLYRLVTNRSVRGRRESLIPEPLRGIVLMATEWDVSPRFGRISGGQLRKFGLPV